MNTRMDYMYRDGCNNKQAEVVIFVGVIGKIEKDKIKAKLDKGTDFLPEQVGLERLQYRFGGINEEDHPWHELLELVDTTEKATTERTAEDFYKAFNAVKKWDENAATKALFGGFAERIKGL